MCMPVFQMLKLAAISTYMFERIIGKLMVAVVLIAWLAGERRSAAQPPVNLRCALRVNPLGIGDVAPRLSWQLQSSGQARGETQSAYQIQVGSTSGAANLWDSGKVASAATVDILYAGQPLTSGKKCFWQVRVYDGSNNVSDRKSTRLNSSHLGISYAVFCL